MANSSGHPNDDGKKAAGTSASSSSDESSSSDDSSEDLSNDREDGARSAPTRGHEKDLAFQARIGQGKLLPTANDSSEDSSNDRKDGARSATTPAQGKDLAFASRLGPTKQLRPVLPTTKIGPPSLHQEIFLNVFTVMCSLPMLVTNFQKTLMEYW